MEISRNFSATRKILNCEPVLFFEFYDTSSYIELHKGSLDFLVDLVEKKGNSVITVPKRIKTNYVYQENKDKIKNLLTTIKIMNEKDRSIFDKNYYELKEYFNVVANHKKYFESIYRFLKG